MTSHPISLAVIVLVVSVAVDDEPGEVISRVDGIRSRITAVRAEASTALADLYARDQALREELRLLEKWTPQSRVQIESSIVNYESQIRHAKEQLERLRAQLQIAMLSDPDERAGMTAAHKAEQADIRAKTNEVRKPFDEQIMAIKRDHPELRQAYADWLSGFVRTPTEAPLAGLEPAPVSVNLDDAFAAVHWNDGSELKVWTHIRLTERPEAREDARLHDARHPVTSVNANSVWLYAGRFQVVLHINEKAWHGPDAALKIIDQFLDLNAMADATGPSPTP